MMLAMRGVVLALLVLCTVPGSHSPTMCIEGGSQNCPWAADLPLGAWENLDATGGENYR